VSDEDVKRFIEHVGVKGMRWGVRKARGSVKPSSDAKRAAELRSRPRQQLTNKQLKTVNERLNLEQNFSRLNPGAVSRGHKTATEILAVVGTAATVYNIVNSPFGKTMIKRGKNLLKKIKHSHMEVGVDTIKHRNSLLLRTIS